MQYTIGYTVRDLSSTEDVMMSCEAMGCEEIVCDLGLYSEMLDALDRMDLPGTKAPEGVIQVSAHRLLPIVPGGRPACGCDDESCDLPPQVPFLAPYGMITVNSACVDNAGGI